MNTYKFTLSDYKAVRNAQIELNGITVLAGENGAGKSTITRWLYYLVEVIAKYDWFVYEDLRDEISVILRNYTLGIRTIQIDNNDINSLVRRWRVLAKKIDCATEENVLRVINEAKEIVIHIADFIQNNIDKEGKLNQNFSRFMIFLDEDFQDFDRVTFINRNIQKIDAAYQNYLSHLHERSITNMFNCIRQHYDSSLTLPKLIHLSEDFVNVIENPSVGYLLGLQRAIYIDTPMAVINESTSNTLWGYLSSLLERSDEKKHISLKTRKMLIRIQHLIHGSIKLKDDEFDYEMRYIREDNLDIPLKDAATGIKTFAYIIRLLENGCLDENTLLIIDEPEAHLHPQWIVEYARILVLLSKELGVRVLIASHNPDMVAAIRSIGAKEGIKERVTFYQANKANNNYEYDYKNLGFEVAEIFQSFNIALSRIQDYGTIAD